MDVVIERKVMDAKNRAHRLLTSKEVSLRLAVSEGTLSRWRKSGTGPLSVVWLGPGSPRYRQVDVDVLVEGPALDRKVVDAR